MQNGETIEKKAECQTCTCKDVGEMTCQEIVCPTLNCEEDQMEIKKDDECCSYCTPINCKSTNLKLLQMALIQYSNENKKDSTVVQPLGRAIIRPYE